MTHGCGAAVFPIKPILLLDFLISILRGSSRSRYSIKDIQYFLKTLRHTSCTFTSTCMHRAVTGLTLMQTDRQLYFLQFYCQELSERKILKWSKAFNAVNEYVGTFWGMIKVCNNGKTNQRRIQRQHNYM